MKTERPRPDFPFPGPPAWGKNTPTKRAAQPQYIRALPRPPSLPLLLAAAWFCASDLALSPALSQRSSKDARVSNL